MGRTGSARKVQRYSLEFKLKAVKPSRFEGVGVQDVAEALDIYPFMLQRWPRRRGTKGSALVAPRCALARGAAGGW